MAWRQGYASDVCDAIVWAAGGEINGVPGIATPAAVISMSFAGAGACPSYLQSSVGLARYPQLALWLPLRLTLTLR